MSHMVIHTPADGTTQYRQFDDLGSAVQFVEEQRNAGVEDAVLFELREIPLAVKSYFKVEIAETGAAETAAEAPAAEAPAMAMPAAEAPAAPAPSLVEPDAEPIAASIAPADDVSYVEAAMASPIDAFANEAPPLGDLGFAETPEVVPPAPSSEGRRGLFGR
ncbi:MAG: hypothetical protein AAGA90_15415 [Actinomycetota bacterium]